MAKLKRILGVLFSQCDHPMIQQGPDGGWYCTECRARVA